MCEDCAVLYDRMKEQEHELYQLKGAVRNLRAEVKFERRQKEKILKEARKNNPNKHYRNGQKRGSYGRHG